MKAQARTPETTPPARVPAPAAGIRQAAPPRSADAYFQPLVAAGGLPLDSPTRARMEGFFGADLGHVRVHRGEDATRVARDADARAVADGANLYFAPLALGVDEGQRTLAHEVAHSLQPRGGGDVATSESFARQAADTYVRGAPRLGVVPPMAPAGVALRDRNEDRHAIRRMIADGDRAAIVRLSYTHRLISLTSAAERAGMVRILTDSWWTRYAEEAATMRLIRYDGQQDAVLAHVDALGYRSRLTASIDDAALAAELSGFLGVQGTRPAGDSTLAAAIADVDTAAILAMGSYRHATHAQRVGALRLLLGMAWSTATEEARIVDLLASSGGGLGALMRDLRGFGLIEPLFDHIDDAAQKRRLIALLQPLHDPQIDEDLRAYQQSAIGAFFGNVGSGIALAVTMALTDPGAVLMGVLRPLIDPAASIAEIVQHVEDLISDFNPASLRWWHILVTVLRDAAGLVAMWLAVVDVLLWLAVAACAGLALLTSETIIFGLGFAGIGVFIGEWAAGVGAVAVGFGIAFLVLAALRAVLDGFTAGQTTTATQKERVQEHIAEDATLVVVVGLLWLLFRAARSAVRSIRARVGQPGETGPAEMQQTSETVGEAARDAQEGASGGQRAIGEAEGQRASDRGPSPAPETEATEPARTEPARTEPDPERTPDETRDPSRTEPRPEAAGARTVPVPTPEETVRINQYLQHMRTLVESEDASARGDARSSLDALEELAVDRHQDGSELAHLWDHLYRLIEAREGIEEGRLQHPVEVGGEWVEGIGRQIGCDATDVGPIEGMAYGELEALLGEPRSVEGSSPGRVRITWRFGDGSMIQLDVPGIENTSMFDINRIVHAHKIAPDTALHLSDSGIGVPPDSTPAHIPIRADAALNARTSR